MKYPLVILGAGEHAKVVHSILDDMTSCSWENIGFLDDKPNLSGEKLLNKPILGPLKAIEELQQKQSIRGALIGISCNHMPTRTRLFEQMHLLNLERPSVISPDAIIHRESVVGNGGVFCGGVVVNAFAKIGDNCVAYSNATVEHECVLGNNVYLGPGVCFCAAVHVGDNTFIGTGASVVCQSVGRDVIIGAGSTVTQDLPDGAIAVGVPAKVIRIRTPEERQQSFIFRHHP